MLLLLNFFLLLSDTKWPGRDTWVYRALLYIPAGINLYVFSPVRFFNEAAVQFCAQTIRLGEWWRQTTSGTFFFYVYFATYSLGCPIGCWRRWRKQAVNERIGRQARLMYYSLLASGLLGALTDLVLALCADQSPARRWGPWLH